jgi:hypothetical protein
MEEEIPRDLHSFLIRYFYNAASTITNIRWPKKRAIPDGKMVKPPRPLLLTSTFIGTGRHMLSFRATFRFTRRERYQAFQV